MKRLVVIAGGVLLLCWGAYHFYTGHIPSGTATHNLEHGRIIALGHGGMGTRSLHTLNSPSSFRKALATGADGTEMDVQLTADGVLVAFHDAVAGEARCPHPIAQHTFSELKSCLAELVTVEEVLAMGWADGSVFSLDVKLFDADIAQQSLFAERMIAVKAHHPQFRILVESTSAAFLSVLKEKGIADGLYLYASDAASALRVCADAGFEGASIRSADISREQVEQFHAQGLRIMLWGVGTRWDNREAVLKGLDIIQSDRLAHLVSLVQQP